MALRLYLSSAIATLAATALGLAANSSCGASHAAISPPRDASPHQDSSDDGVSSGAIVVGIYRINDLVRLESSTQGETALVSTVVGLSSIERVVRTPSGDYRAELIAPPPTDACKPFPLSVAAFDAARHGKRDILVADGCADWVALDDGRGSLVAEVASPRLAQPEPASVMLVLNPSNTVQIVASADNQQVLAQFNRIADPQEQVDANAFVARTSGPQILSREVTNIIVGWSFQDGTPSSCLIQSPGKLFFCPEFLAISPDSPPLLSDGWTLTPPRPPYLATFEAFDHLQPLAIRGCKESLLGIGMFRSSYVAIPRRLQHLTLTQEGQFEHSEIPTPFEVTTFTAVPNGDGTALVGFLGEESGKTVFALAEVRECDGWTLLGKWEADGGWRTPDAPQFLAYGPRVPMTPGIALAGFRATVAAQDGYVFVNYDGYAIRAWEFTASSIEAGSPEPHSIIRRIHDNRSDLVFGP